MPSNITYGLAMGDEMTPVDQEPIEYHTLDAVLAARDAARVEHGDTVHAYRFVSVTTKLGNPI